MLLIIIENGLGILDYLIEDGKIYDDYWIVYLYDYIVVCYVVIFDGVELFGYCFWLVMDILSFY